MEFRRELARHLPAQQGRRDKAGEDSERYDDSNQPDRYLACARVVHDFGSAAAQLCDFRGHLSTREQTLDSKIVTAAVTRCPS